MAGLGIEYLADSPDSCPVDVPVVWNEGGGRTVAGALDPAALFEVLDDDLLVEVGFPLKLEG